MESTIDAWQGFQRQKQEWPDKQHTELTVLLGSIVPHPALMDMMCLRLLTHVHCILETHRVIQERARWQFWRHTQ
jgi:hypothetical protein